MTPKPSDSMSERARELANKYLPATDYTTNNSARNDLENDISAALTDAFNLGAGGAYAVAVQTAHQTPFRAHSDKDVDFHSGCVQTRDGIVDAIRQRTPHDAIAAVERIRADERFKVEHEFHNAVPKNVYEADVAALERKVSEARLELRKEMKAAGAHIGEQDEEIARLQAEAAGKEGGK